MTSKYSAITCVPPSTNRESWAASARAIRSPRRVAQSCPPCGMFPGAGGCSVSSGLLLVLALEKSFRDRVLGSICSPRLRATSPAVHMRFGLAPSPRPLCALCLAWLRVCSRVVLRGCWWRVCRAVVLCCVPCGGVDVCFGCSAGAVVVLVRGRWWCIGDGLGAFRGDSAAVWCRGSRCWFVHCGALVLWFVLSVWWLARVRPRSAVGAEFGLTSCRGCCWVRWRSWRCRRGW